MQFQKDEATQKDCKAGLEILRKHNAKKRSAEPIANGEPPKKRKYETTGKTSRDGKGRVVTIWKKLMLLNASRPPYIMLFVFEVWNLSKVYQYLFCGLEKHFIESIIKT